MAFPKYESYKDSGVDWLGEIPEHWELLRTKSIFRLVAEPAPKNNSEELLSVYSDIGVKPRKELEERGNKASTTDGYWYVKKGDVIVNKLLAWMGAIGVSEYDGVTSPAYDILRSYKPVESKFYHYLFRNPICTSKLKQHSKGIMEMRLRLYFDEFGNIKIPYPPFEEQQRIVAFLDRTTAEIDEAIAKKQRLIELLQEQKAILINQAVTKGLNPNVPMRNSGIEWIGEIPEHWEVKRLKRLFAEFDDRSLDGTETLLSLRMYEGLVPHTEVSDKPITSNDLIGYKRVKPGEIVMNRMRAALGLFAVASTEGIVSPDYAIFRSFVDLIPDFYVHLFKTSKRKNIFFLESKGLGTGSAGFLRLYSDRFGCIKVPVPPVPEQVKIISHIKYITNEFAILISKINDEILLLQEFRNVVISNVVTGKIKL